MEEQVMKKPTNLFKRAAIALMAASIVAATPAVASAAWETSGKGWNWIVNGQKATGWQWIDSQWYFMDTDGTMKTGWVQDGGSWYYLAPSGEMKTGWAQVGGTWYYLKSSGAMATGWVSWNGSWYRMNTSGAMITGWTSWDGGWYYMAPAGDMATGVIKVDGATYAMDASGKMQTGEVTVAGKTYTFGEDGAAVGDAPEATRTFVSGPSGASETTTGGTGGSGTTTPEKPSRPSTGGGSSPVTPTPDPNPGDPDPKPPVTENRTDVAEKQDDITTAAALETFLADIATKNYTHADGIVVDIASGITEVDFSELSAKKVTIANVPAGTTVTLNPLCLEVIVQKGCTIVSEEELPKVTVNSAARVADTDHVTLNAPIDVLIITAAPNAVIASKNVASAQVAAAPLTINTGATVTALTVKTGAGTIDGAGNIGTVTAEVDATIANTGSVTTINGGSSNITLGTAADGDAPASGPDVTSVTTSGNVIVQGGTASAVTTSSSGTITVNDGTVTSATADTGKITVTGGTVTNVESAGTEIEITGGDVETIVATGSGVGIVLPAGTTKDDAPNIIGSNVSSIKDADTDTAIDGLEATAPTANPAAGKDYSIENPDATHPTTFVVKLGTDADKKDLQFKDTDGTWKPFSTEKSVAFNGSLDIRAIAGNVPSGKVTLRISDDPTNNYFNNFANDGYLYKASVKFTGSGWETVGGKDYWVEAGKKLTAAAWKPTTVPAEGQKEADNWTYVGADSVKTAAVFNATGITVAENVISGLEVGMRFKAPGADWVVIANNTDGYNSTAKTLTVSVVGDYQIAHPVEIEGVTTTVIKSVTKTTTLPKAEAPAKDAVDVTGASETSPTKGRIAPKAAAASGETAPVLQYAVMPANNKTEDLKDTDYHDLGTGAEVDAGKVYVIRVKASDTNSASVPTTLDAVPTFTGTSTANDTTKDKYYINSEVAEDGWHENVIETGKTESAKKTIHTSGGIVSVSKWIEAPGADGEKGQKVYVDGTGASQGDYGLYKVKCEFTPDTEDDTKVASFTLSMEAGADVAITAFSYYIGATVPDNATWTPAEADTAVNFEDGDAIIVWVTLKAGDDVPSEGAPRIKFEPEAATDPGQE